MDNNNLRIRNPKKEKIIEALVRWWGAGAIYFFIGWGTGLGNQSDPLDFIFILGLAAGLLTITILDPIIYNMLDIERKDGELMNKKYHERTIIQNVIVRTSEIFKAVFIVFLVFLTYNGLNILIINIGNLEPTEIPLKGEPILFGLFYLAYFMLIRLIIRLVPKKGA